MSKCPKCDGDGAFMHAIGIVLCPSCFEKAKKELELIIAQERLK